METALLNINFVSEDIDLMKDFVRFVKRLYIVARFNGGDHPEIKAFLDGTNPYVLHEKSTIDERKLHFKEFFLKNTGIFSELFRLRCKYSDMMTQVILI